MLAWAIAVAVADAGIQGHRIYIDEDGDAEANYTVVALLRDEQQRDPEMAGKSLQPIGHFMLRQHDIPVCIGWQWHHSVCLQALRRRYATLQQCDVAN